MKCKHGETEPGKVTITLRQSETIVILQKMYLPRLYELRRVLFERGRDRACFLPG
jgi:hypothetical protein